ncbi:hypothetical protein HG535_0A07310 [Zygotorulaspora mrakii]|uniref:Thiaminase-2/PQQC domain-containing protein n=1 Tax=Zygotorulaspora mrakii TaxID=42260 RepID=A0A7H9AYE4_ZYGMR|nr:uncharacterized protein HG535_0A07310 [Zygotorulaspora mrakii]QLG70789.1 hypothetical protein HG535_0A07310 [Zygotorulaspora mrakii]
MVSTTDSLVLKYKDLFRKTTQHPLTNELCLGTLPDRILYVYLAQDLQFFESGLRGMCNAASMTPDTNSLLTLSKQIGHFANAENDYFHECLSEIKSSVTDEEQKYYSTQYLPEVKVYMDFLIEKRSDRKKYAYPQLVAAMWIAELVYWTWAHDSPRAKGLHWKYQTWIDLHDGEKFETWLRFLKEEVDKLKAADIEDMFKKTLELEYDFFQSCYTA